MRHRPLFLAAALVASCIATLDAQECVGIPKNTKGFFAVGPSGTDGAGGTGMSFGYQGSNRSLMFRSQSLGVFAHANPQKTTAAQGAFRIDKLRGCLTIGANRQTWDTEGAESRGWSIDDPDAIWERHSVGGSYHRLRFPLGLSFGRSIAWGRTTLVPYVNPFIVYEMEDFRPSSFAAGAPSQSRRSLGGGLEIGTTLRAGWFTARPMLNITNTRDRALSGKKNFAEIAIHFGVVF